MTNWSAPQRPAVHAEQALLTAILDGTYPPGATLPGERELAARRGRLCSGLLQADKKTPCRETVGRLPRKRRPVLPVPQEGGELRDVANVPGDGMLGRVALVPQRIDEVRHAVVAVAHWLSPVGSDRRPGPDLASSRLLASIPHRAATAS